MSYEHKVQCLTTLAIFIQLAISDGSLSLNINAPFLSVYIKLCRSSYNHSTVCNPCCLSGMPYEINPCVIRATIVENQSINRHIRSYAIAECG